MLTPNFAPSLLRPSVPAINYAHPACQNILFSYFSGTGLGNADLVQLTKGTVTGATTGTTGMLGQTVNLTSTNHINFTGRSTTLETNFTFWWIGQFTNVTTAGSIFTSSSASTGWNIQYTAGGTLVIYPLGGSERASTITLATGIPYLIVVSVAGLATNFLVKRLDTGAISTSVTTGADLSSAPNGTFVVGATVLANDAANWNMAAASFSLNFMPLGTIIQAASYPWSPWQPAPPFSQAWLLTSVSTAGMEQGQAVFSGAGNLTDSGEAVLLEAVQATFTGTGAFTDSGQAVLQEAAQAAFTGTGALTDSGEAVLLEEAQATFSGAGLLTSNPLMPQQFASATFAGIGAFTANGILLEQAQATFSGVGNLTDSGEAVLLEAAQANFVGAGLLAANGVDVPSGPTIWQGQATFVGAGGFTDSGEAVLLEEAQAAFFGTGAFSDSGEATLLEEAQAALFGSGFLTVDGFIPGAPSTWQGQSFFAGTGSFVANGATATLVILPTGGAPYDDEWCDSWDERCRRLKAREDRLLAMRQELGIVPPAVNIVDETAQQIVHEGYGPDEAFDAAQQQEQRYLALMNRLRGELAASKRYLLEEQRLREMFRAEVARNVALRIEEQLRDDEEALYLMASLH